MAKEKNKPVPVRFDLKMLEVLKEEEKIDTPQQALNFLTKFWENNRPAKDDPASGNASGSASNTSAPAKATKTSGTPPKKTDKRDSPASSTHSSGTAHPSGLSGIELAIWKAEQKEKNG